MNARELFAMLMEYPQPTRTEVLEALETLTRNYEQERVTALIADFSDLLYQWKCEITYNRAKWAYEEDEQKHRAEYDEIFSVYEKQLNIVNYQLAMGTNDPIQLPEEPQPYIPLQFIPPMPGTIADNIHIPPIYEYSVEVLRNHYENNQESHQLNAQNLPPELSTPQAAKIFQRAKEEGLINDGYNWLKGKQFLACFARRMSLALNLGKGLNPDGTQRISWKPFEDLFGYQPGKLRSNYNDVKGKYGESQEIERTLNRIFQ